MDGAGRVIGAPAMRSEVLAADASLKGAAGSARHRGFSNSAACALAPGRACVVWEKPRGRRGDCRRLLPIYRPTGDLQREFAVMATRRPSTVWLSAGPRTRIKEPQNYKPRRG